MRVLKLLHAVVVGTIMISAPIKVFADEDNPGRINVTGTGTVSVAPDMAIISVGVLREADTARSALDENNKAMASVLGAMKENGIAEKDLQTSGFSIQPRYLYPKRQSNGEQPAPEIIGYAVSNNLDIRIRDLAKTGELLDLVVTLGVNSGGQIRFTNDDPNEFLKKARIAAVKDAMEKAKTLAEAASVELGEIINISENSGRTAPAPIADARSFSTKEAAAVPIAGGENSYHVNVQVSWEIDQ